MKTWRNEQCGIQLACLISWELVDFDWVRFISMFHYASLGDWIRFCEFDFFHSEISIDRIWSMGHTVGEIAKKTSISWKWNLVASFSIILAWLAHFCFRRFGRATVPHHCKCHWQINRLHALMLNLGNFTSNELKTNSKVWKQMRPPYSIASWSLGIDICFTCSDEERKTPIKYIFLVRKLYLAAPPPPPPTKKNTPIVLH